MTTPTQAQIEAAAKAIWVADNFPTPWEKGFEDDRTHYSKLADAALTAAAEVGDKRWQEIASQGIQIESELRKELLTIEVATIERCAQVLEQLGARYHSGHDLPAAIRALKDEGLPTAGDVRGILKEEK